MKNSAIRFLIIFTLCAYTFFKIIQLWPTHFVPAGIITFLFLTLMTSWLFTYHAKPHLVNQTGFQIFVWLGSLCMGLWSTYILLSLPIDIGFLVVYFLRFFINAITIDTTHLLLLSQKMNLLILVISLSITVLGFIEVLRGPQIKKLNLPLPNLPDTLKNLKIVQLSDLHVGPTIGKKYVEKVVKLSNALKPDLIIVTGDLADAKVATIEQHLQPLAALQAPLGIYYVTGNHEYYWDAEEWIAKAKTLGFVPLINENRLLRVEDAAILIAGVTDSVGGQFIATHQPNMTKAAHSLETAQLKILLAHRPGVYIEAEKLGFDLQFSGHTHSGQFFPFNLLIPLVHKYHSQLNQHGNLSVYVNPGTGYWGPANRFGVPAEITLCCLQKQAEK